MRIRTGRFTGIILCAIILLSGALGYQIAFGTSLGAASYPLPGTVNVGTVSSPSFFTNVVLIMLEGQSGDNYPPNTPSSPAFMAGLYTTWASTKQMHHEGSPSLPNYIAITSGSTQGITDDNPPSSHQLGVTNIVDRLEGAGLTWTAYAESYPVASGCTQSTSNGSYGTYYARHFPFNYYTDIESSTTRCANLVDAGGSGDPNLIAALNSATPPNWIWFTPNGCNDGHDCGPGTVDTYLSTLIPAILSTTTFTTKNAALVITMDENNQAQGNPIYTVWLGPSAKKAYSDSVSYNHYNILRTWEDNWGLASLCSSGCTTNYGGPNGDAAATAMSQFFGQSTSTPDFGLTANPASVTFTAGSTAPSTITMTVLNGFAGAVALTSSSPSGITTTCSTSSLSSTALTSTCTFSASSAASGTVTVTGTSGSLTHSATVAVSATSQGTPDFGLSANPASVSFAVGGMASSTITLSPTGGFAGTATLTPSSPSGMSTSCSPTILGGNNLTSTCAFRASSALTGNVTITGTSGTLTHTTSISVTATSSTGSGNFDPSQWSLTANSPSSAAISGGTLQETVIDTASSYSGSFYSTAQYLRENGFSGPPINVSTFSAHVNIGTINMVSSGYLYHVYMGLYFTLPSAVTAGGLTSNWIDGQVQVEQCSSSISGGCDPTGYTYNTNLGNRFGYREILTTQGANSAYDFVNFDVKSYCARAEAAWGIPSTPCTLVRIEPGMEGYGVNPFSIVWTTFSVTGSSRCANGANNPPACDVCPAGQTIVNGICVSPDFGMSVSPTSLSAVQGTGVTSAISLSSINSFAATVTLSGVSSSSSITVTFNPSSVTLAAGGQASSTVTLSTTSSTQAGSYTITVKGVAGTISHSVTLSLTVTSPPPSPNFAISASPATLNVVQGSAASSTITLTSLSGFSGNISLVSSTSASGSTSSLASSLVTLSASGTATDSLTISAGSSTPAGTYSTNVTATSGSLSYSVTISVIVALPPDFQLSSSQSSISVAQGSSGLLTMTLTSLNSFTGSVSLAATTSSVGFTVSFSPSRLSLASGGQASSSLTVPISNAVPTGTYTVSITGTGPGTSHSVIVSIVVTVPVTQPLQGSISWSPATPIAGQTVTFTASAVNGVRPYSFVWTFGDGSSSSGVTVSHAYSGSGNFTVSLTVTDASTGAASSQTILTVVPNSVSAVVLEAPGSEIASAGSMLTFTVNASNPQAPGMISISVSNMPLGSVFTSTPGNPAVGTFSWDPTSSVQAGSYKITFLATQAGSSYSSSKTVTVNLAGASGGSCFLCGSPLLWEMISLAMIGATIGLVITFSGAGFLKAHKTRVKGLPSAASRYLSKASDAALAPLSGKLRTAGVISRRGASAARVSGSRKDAAQSRRGRSTHSRPVAGGARAKRNRNA